MKTHKLKTLSEYFQDVDSGLKTFEIRKNDRSFKVGDTLELLEYDKESDQITGNLCLRQITYIVEGGKFGLEKDFVVMGIKPL